MPKYSTIRLIPVLIIVSIILFACRSGANATPLPLLTQASPTPREVIPTPVISEKTTLLPYTHSSGRFSLSYPQAWQPFERPDGVIFIEPEAQAGYSVIFSDVEKPYTPKELNQYLVTFIAQNFAGEGSNFKAISQEERADGAVVAQFSSTDPNLGQAISQVTVWQEGNTVFVLHLSATEPQWEVSAQSLQALTEKFTSLEVKTPVATAQTPADAPVVARTTADAPVLPTPSVGASPTAGASPAVGTPATPVARTSFLELTCSKESSSMTIKSKYI